MRFKNSLQRLSKAGHIYDLPSAISTITTIPVFSVCVPKCESIEESIHKIPFGVFNSKVTRFTDLCQIGVRVNPKTFLDANFGAIMEIFQPF